MSRVGVIREYFEKDGGRKVQFSEIKALTAEDRIELSDAAAKELGVEITTA